jgi:uncharacterized membrane protein
MPKQFKTKAKSKANLKAKSKNEPQTPGFTSSKSYWVMLSAVMAVAVSVAGFMINLAAGEVAALTVTIVLLIGLMGHVRITPSNLSISKRATFLFVGASIIGFGVWGAIMYVLMATGLLTTVITDYFMIIPSLIICLIIGAFIGELLGRNSRVQGFFFKPENL